MSFRGWRTVFFIKNKRIHCVENDINDIFVVTMDLFLSTRGSFRFCKMEPMVVDCRGTNWHRALANSRTPTSRPSSSAKFWTSWCRWFRGSSWRSFTLSVIKWYCTTRWLIYQNSQMVQKILPNIIKIWYRKSEENPWISKVCILKSFNCRCFKNACFSVFLFIFTERTPPRSAVSSATPRSWWEACSTRPG